MEYNTSARITYKHRHLVKLLAIETSCDDTSVALLNVTRDCVHVVAQMTASQIDLHQVYGGVVPEIAARAHAETIAPLVMEVLAAARVKKPDAIAVTCGPGLVTSLWVGVIAAKTLAWQLNVPVYGVNHILGHVYSSLLEKKLPKFPVLALVVSGGHTELLLLRRPDQWKKIGATRDDAAGEAFDKFAKVLGLPYPGGPAISKRAVCGRANAIDFPRPMLRDVSFDFSFAGLKTAGRLWADAHPCRSKQMVADACASYNRAIVDVLVHKTERAIKKFHPATILLGGGVAANDSLRNALQEACGQQGTHLLLPEKKFTTDNAAMIGAAAYFTKRKFLISWKKLRAQPEWEL